MIALSNLVLSLLCALSVTNGRVLTRVQHARLVKKEEFRPPHGWIIHDSAPEAHTIHLRIGLTQPNFKVLEQHLYEISDPMHSRYGMHLSKSEVEALVAPHPESVDLVHEWLAGHGLASDDLGYSPARDWITMNMTIKQAEVLLDTEYHIWKHVDSGDTLVRTTQYSVPEHLLTHIDVIQPTTMFARLNPQRRAVEPMEDASISDDAATDPSCNTTITLKCLQDLYNVTGYVPRAANKGNKIGITGYLGQHANEADFQTFFAMNVPDAVNFTFNTILLNNGTNPQTDAGTEANLDVQYAFGLAFPTPATFWSTGGSPPFDPDLHTPTNTNEPYQDWLDFVLAQPDLPQAISTSYGDDEQTVPESFAQRVCNGFAQLGARGVSVMFSSGDDGVGDGDPNPATQTCITNDGKNNTRFIPEFPASCPFVTSVGGTHNIPEVAVAFSGGGFSNYFARPLYQEPTVAKYLSELAPGTYEGLFNRNGRGIPDVSGQSVRFQVTIHNVTRSVSGTSASSPSFTGIIALANDARIAAGRPPLGFLNPFLYTVGHRSFNDITIGNNPGCGTPGFNTSVGWDPVSGFGTIDFAKFKDLALLF